MRRFAATGLAVGLVFSVAPLKAQPSPNVDEVVAAALDVAALDPRRAGRVADRARWSGLLPSLRVGARRGFAQDSSATLTGETDRTNLSQDDDLSFDGTLTFDLGRLVFAREEVSLLREERSIELERRALIREVVHTYFERERLWLEIASGAGGSIRRMHALELEALLDAWTGGRFVGRWRRRAPGP